MLTECSTLDLIATRATTTCFFSCVFFFSGICNMSFNCVFFSRVQGLDHNRKSTPWQSQHSHVQSLSKLKNQGSISHTAKCSIAIHFMKLPTVLKTTSLAETNLGPDWQHLLTYLHQKGDSGITFILSLRAVEPLK